MAWLLWLSLGVVLGIALLVGLAHLSVWQTTTPTALRARTVRLQRQLAEQRMEQAVQDTVARLFDTVRPGGLR